jgi:catechol 2,3-dioxygenase-like lactoylglutathione lyase family enzyme
MSEDRTGTRITHIGRVIVPVADQDAALEFFTEALGFEVRMDGTFGAGQRWIEVAPPGAETAIALVPQGSSTGIEVSLVTEDAESDHATLLEQGVQADAELIRFEGVPPMFTFLDPDGNPFRMVERADG